MTVPTPIQQRIRVLDARGVSWRRIAKEVGVSRQTVRKYAQMEDCSPEPPMRPAAVSKLDPYKPLIDKWLEADRFMPRKQRHTARRVYDRLVFLFNCLLRFGGGDVLLDSGVLVL